LFFRASTLAVVLFLLVWGASVIADSGVFSTSLTEIADEHWSAANRPRSASC
jgi:hypothetical protein